ncbi:MAG: hypothetical protein ACF8OB_03410 [Phycisphaeraceae bacterium JB051]
MALTLCTTPITAQTLEPDLSRFSPVPEPYVHPRVLISPQDLPTLRTQLRETAYGRRASQSIRAWLSYASRQGEPLYETYRALVEGKDNALKLAANDWWANNVPVMLQLQAFDCLIADDNKRGKEVAAAITTYANVYGGNHTPLGYKNVNPNENLALAYDFAYNFMTNEQREIVRSVIAKSTHGRKSHGMDKPAHKATYNFYTHGTYLLTTALCIEGERGYDATIYPATVKLINDYLTYAIGPNGTPTEGMHYYNFGMNNAARAMIAIAKRGDNLFRHPNYAKTINWYVQSIEPFGYHFSQHGDTPNDNGGLLANYVALKCVFPNDPVVDFVWRNRVRDDYSGVQYRGDLLTLALYGSQWDKSPGKGRVPLATQWGVDNNVAHEQSKVPWDPASLNLPLSFYGPNRGLMISRNAWQRDAAVMHFECRTDVYGPSHAHANRGDFTLSALGRKWVIDRGYHQSESFMHSIIQIDGKGQGFFCPSGKILNQQSTDLYDSITADIAYPYQYRYTFGTRLGQAANKDYQWEPETKPEVIKHSSDSQTADDKPWLENDLYTHRAINNPVRYAFRTATFVRGEQPYVLIVDDIRKDDDVHLYEWLMQVPDDLVIEKIAADHVILKSENADDNAPRLWVKVIHAADPTDNRMTDSYLPIRLETYHVARTPSSGSAKSFGIGKRLVISSSSVSPGFKILILPYRPQDGLPKVSELKEQKLQIQWGDIVDHWQFTMPDDQRTLPVIQRK